MRLARRLEPLAAAAVELDVAAAVGAFEQTLDRLPDGKVDDNHRIASNTHGSRIAILGLVAPDEPRRAIAEFVDGLEVGDEISEERMVQRRDETRDVVLSEVIFRRGRFLGHKITLSQVCGCKM